MVLFFFIFVMSFAMADDQLEVIHVQHDINEGLISAGKVKDSIIKTEVITHKKIERKQAQNLIQAIDNEPGIQTLNGCSICGIKRVQINGLRGEHTTVMVDGIPMHSTVSSYYGFEALGTLGVANIEVARGSGAALSAPEAIGGVVNIVTQKAKENKTVIDISGGNNDYQNLTLISTAVGQEGKRRTTIAGQYSKMGQWDSDDNGVNEAADRDTRSAMAKYSQDIGSRTNVDLRVNTLKASIFGGPMGKHTFETTVQTPVSDVDQTSFENGDVRKKFIGDQPGQVAEIIDVVRNEAALKLTQDISESLNWIGTVSYAKTTQDSWYEGADYYNADEAYFYDLKLNFGLNDQHFLTLGADLKQEELRSKSQAFFAGPTPQAKDSFNYFSPGIYLQDVWNATEALEVSAALRVNKVQTDWIDQKTKKNEIDESIFAPRLHLRYKHNEALESRLAYGKGYRAPLTFFESEHGILEDGFDIAVNELETSDSYTYALTHTGQSTTTTVGGSWTKVKDISFVDMSGTRPVLRNYSDRDVEITTLDGSIGWQVTPEFSVGLTYEKYLYQELYKRLSPVANIEQRSSLILDYDKDKFDVSTTITWIGARNLEPYGYKDRFNIFDGTNVSSQKRGHAPDFFTVDLQGVYKLTKDTSLTVGARNLFDYVQTESPLYFNSAGEFDVNHVWGPLIGRQVYAGLKSVF